MKKITFFLFFFTIALTLKAENTEKKVPSTIDNNNIEITSPIQSIRTKRFKIQHLSINKVVESKGNGEILEFEFQLKNELDLPKKYYIFVIATYEVKPKNLTSFDRPKKQKQKLWNLVPFPNNIKNFEYTIKNKKKLIKYPINIKEGINPYTAKPYILTEKLVFRSTHLAKYKINYHFFNNATLLIFDENEKLIYRQEYSIYGIK